MGGFGSGRRPSYGGSRTTEASMPLDIRKLKRAGALMPGATCRWEWNVNGEPVASIGVQAHAWSVTLAYRHRPYSGPAEDVRQTLSVVHTPCHLGGQRPWFICPACYRRVAVVYGAGRLFACRTCKRLAYASQGESSDDRAARRADRIRKRLGWKPGFLNGPGLKPKGMHWRTYWTLLRKHDALIGISMQGIAKRLGFLERLVSED